MVEPIMFFGIGFLVAGLLGLIFIPVVHARAVRLTMRRLEASTPLSMAEIQADKDQLRAEFAMSTRRLEMSVEQLKAKTTNQLAELGKKSEAINRLKVELNDKNATIVELEARDKALQEQLHATEEELSVKVNAMRAAEQAVAAKEAELGQLTATLDEKIVMSDTQRAELVAMRRHVVDLKERVGDFEQEVRKVEDRLTRERTDADHASRELASERRKVDTLGGRVAELERQLTAQTTETDILGNRAEQLEMRLANQGRLLAERDYQCDQLRGQLDALRKTEADLRAEFGEIEARHSAETGSLKAEKALAEEQLDRAREERAKLHREIARMKRETEAAWTSERVENALLRERINDVAAEVARLTMALEGPDSAMEELLAEAATHGHANGKAGSAAKDSGAATARDPREGQGGQGNLADRIRALQSRASRVSQPN
jgi:chromosome segregation ATPase